MDINRVNQYLRNLQTVITRELQIIDGQSVFAADSWEREAGGGGCSMVLRDGAIFEQAGVNFSEVDGDKMPASARAHRPEREGRRFRAMGVSLVIHPHNPYIPTSHANVRFFIAEKDGEDPIWWFGGGFDLTPYYGFEADCRHWHNVARQACEPFGTERYAHYKQWCDDYFYLRHRQEARGIGGLFFDDLNEPDFEQAFAFMRSVGDHYLPAYTPIIEAHRNDAFGAREKQFQLYRRGRYVEFNLVYDRGTLFGLQSGGRTESILMSLPPVVNWRYNYQPEAGSAEAELTDYYLVAKDWLAEQDDGH